MYYGMNYQSTLGDIFIVSDEENIVGLWIGDDHKYMKDAMPGNIIKNGDIPILKEASSWLDDYFSCGKPEIYRLPLLPEYSTDFRKIVWDILLDIPNGELTTYGEIAREVAKRMGKEKMSAQAVGGAVGHNPISIIIPCHRVVGRNGNLTGYGGGMDVKIKLLTHEGVDMDKLFVPTNSTAP